MTDSRVVGGRSPQASRRFRPLERRFKTKIPGRACPRRTLVRPDRTLDPEIQEIRKCSATLRLRRGFIFAIKDLKIQTVEDQPDGGAADNRPSAVRRRRRTSGKVVTSARR